MREINELVKDAIVQRGNLENIKKVMRNGENGKPITIGFIGGSITQGSLASSPKTCYAYLVYQWWVSKFPKASVKYRNAGIGATTSHFGCARVEQDLLRFEPNILIIDFSVNDNINTLNEETFEGLIRKILDYNIETGIIVINHVNYESGENTQFSHNKIAKHYGLPCISLKNSLYPCVKSKLLLKEDITPDDLHPNDLGHKLVSDIVNGVLEHIYLERNEKEDKIDLPKPFTRNAYEKARIYQNSNSNFIAKGFICDSSKKEDLQDIFKSGWFGERKGDTLTFYLEGTEIAIQYKKTIQRPAPKAKVFVNEKETDIILDANFEENWGDCLYTQPIIIHGKEHVYQIKIQIIESSNNGLQPLYISSIITSYE